MKDIRLFIKRIAMMIYLCSRSWHKVYHIRSGSILGRGTDVVLVPDARSSALMFKARPKPH